MQKSISPLKLSMPNSSGLSKLTFKLKTLDNQILHRNFMHFEVNSNKKLNNVEVFSLPPKEISNSNWTKRKWDVLNGKKVNGAGSGFFEYKIQIPENFKNLNFKEAYFIIEASANKLFDKDKKGEDYVDAGMDWMRGSIVSPSKNPNSYPMTDETFFPSEINISIND